MLSRIMTYHANKASTMKARVDKPLGNSVAPQAAQTLFVIYIRDSIALRFDPFIKRMYENGLKIALNSTCSKGFK